MITILSPSKTLDFKDELSCKKKSKPQFADEAFELVKILKKLSTAKLASQLKLSEKLAKLNHERFSSFDPQYNKDNSRQALLAYRGDVYQGFELNQYSEDDFAFAQDHLRIISGLYGLLRPLDLIQPYRLEMGTKLKNSSGADLYHYWSEQVTESLNKAAKKVKATCIINLASNEYSKAVLREQLDFPVIDCVFKEKRGKDYKVIGLMAKKARGLMADYIVRKQIEEPSKLKRFKRNGYSFSSELSSDTSYIFLGSE